MHSIHAQRIKLKRENLGETLWRSNLVQKGLRNSETACGCGCVCGCVGVCVGVGVGVCVGVCVGVGVWVCGWVCGCVKGVWGGGCVCGCVFVCAHVCSVVSDSLRPHGLYPTRLLCPWDSPGKNTGVGCHFLLQGIFLTQGSNSRVLRLLHWQADS